MMMHKIIGVYQNGNYKVSVYDDGTKVRKTDDDEFIPAYSESCDVNLTMSCQQKCKFCYLGATPDGKHGRIDYDFLKHLHPYTEMALNGNDLNHPQLLNLLELLKEQKVFANITVNQKQFMDNLSLIRMLVNAKLIWGIGVSLIYPSDEFINAIKEFNNAVIHTINGFLSEQEINKLAYKGLKILVLGYKIRGRGDDYYAAHKDGIEANKKWLNEHLNEVTKQFKVVSFDNLAIEQLPKIKEVVGNKWDEFYMGDDGNFTFYIDLVKGTFAKNSCIDECFPIGNKTIDEMFNFIREKYNK